MSEMEEAISATLEHQSESRLNAVIAVLVALTATFMALCNVKDGNIVQAMEQAQAKGVDTWQYYQAESIKLHLAEHALEQSRLQLLIGSNLSAAAQHALTESIGRAEAEVKKFTDKKTTIQQEATGYQAEYDRLNRHDDQFDMADACLSLAIALYGITALTRKRWLFAFAVGLMAIGISLGLAGFVGWDFHPDWLAVLLS